MSFCCEFFNNYPLTHFEMCNTLHIKTSRVSAPVSYIVNRVTLRLEDMKKASGKTIERLSMYRRLLQTVGASGQISIYSHDIAELADVTAAQVRRDLMEIGCPGSRKKGYEVTRLLDAICEFLDNPDVENVALVGVGNLGRALLQFFSAHHPKLKIVAAFDADPKKAGRVICGTRCYAVNEMADVITEQKISVAIVAVPGEAAQATTIELQKAGIKGILNFVPEPLRAAPDVSVENIDMTSALEKVAFMARLTTA